jgi:hypothetical protein
MRDQLAVASQREAVLLGIARKVPGGGLPRLRSHRSTETASRRVAKAEAADLREPSGPAARFAGRVAGLCRVDLGACGTVSSGPCKMINASVSASAYSVRAQRR